MTSMVFKPYKGESGVYVEFTPRHLKGVHLLVKPEWINKIYSGAMKITSLDRTNGTYAYA